MEKTVADAVGEKAQGYSGRWWNFPPLRGALLAAAIALTTFILERLGLLPRQIAIGAYALSIPIGGWHWIREGISELIAERIVGIEVLMIAATTGAALLGMWDEAAALVVLYGAAEGLEEYTYARTRNSIRALLDLAPKEASVLRDGTETRIPAAAVKPGDRFLVRPGEALVTDGKIVEGFSSINEASITGESMPVTKGVGANVFAGSLNVEGALTIEATKAFADNSLSRIIHLVEAANEQKGRAQQWIERFGRRYTPAVLAAAALLLLGPWVLGLPMDLWANRAVVLLVAAAPCALIMSMPMAMAAGIGSAGRQGILIKGGAHLEHLGKISIVAFDKTGTLTQGKPAVTDVLPEKLGSDELLRNAAAVEHFSQHPLAKAIVAEADRRKLNRPVAADFQSVIGGGAKATIDARVWLIGSPAFMREQQVAISSMAAKIEELQKAGKTAVVVAANGEALGIIALQDQLRPEAHAVIRELHDRGVKTVMLTGDNELTGNAVAKQLGIDDVRASLKPEDKVSAIRELEASGKVLMVGDGVNDAPALAAATCSAAMGAAGSDAAIEAADVALMADDLRKVTVALDFGLKARRVSLQNIVLSIAVLVVMIPLALTGILGVATTVLVHEVAELLAVANGWRAGAVEGIEPTIRSRAMADVN